MAQVSDLTLATMTMNSNIDILLNLEVVTKCIPLNEYIVGKSCDAIGSWGLVNEKKRKNKKNKRLGRTSNKNSFKEDFFNQCTLIVHPYSQSNPRKVNVKLFNNGQIVMTGCKHQDEANLTIKIIIDGLKTNFTERLTYKACNSISDYEPKIKIFHKFMRTSAPSMRVILNYAIKKGVTYFDNIKDMNFEQLDVIMDKESEKEIMLLVKFYKIFCKIYMHDDEFNKLDNEFMIKRVMDPIIEGYNGEVIECVLPAYVEPQKLFHPDYKVSTRIDLINSYFYTSFQIDRLKIQQILVNKYKKSADLNPDKYQAVNVKYVSVANCKSKEHNICKCKTRKKCTCACTCKEISIFIFNKGTIIITGARMWEQILDTYNFIKNVLIEEYDTIHLLERDFVRKVKKIQYPDKVIENGVVYLNKEFVMRNPKNYFLLKHIFSSEKIPYL
jgi:hypothetical protein